MMARCNVKIWLATIALALWVCALILPAQARVCPDGVDVTRGWAVLMFGWLGPFTLDEARGVIDAIGRCAWFANPMWVFSIYRLYGGRRPSLSWSIAATLLAASAPQSRFEYIGDEHGICGPDVAQIGAFLWVAAISLPLIGLLLSRQRQEPAVDAR